TNRPECRDVFRYGFPGITQSGARSGKPCEQAASNQQRSPVAINGVLGGPQLFQACAQRCCVILCAVIHGGVIWDQVKMLVKRQRYQKTLYVSGTRPSGRSTRGLALVLAMGLAG